MVTETIEVGVVFDPRLKLWTAAREHTFQQIQSRVDIAQLRIATRHIILSKNIVIGDDQCSGDPFPGTLRFAQLNKSSNTHAGRPRIFRMEGKLTLGSFDASPCSTLGILITAKRPVDLNQ